MQETLEEINVLQSKGRGCVTNLWGACLVGRDREGHSYAARTVSRGRPSRRPRDRGGVLNMVMMIVRRGARAGYTCAQARRMGRDTVPRIGGRRRAGGK